MVSGHLVVQGQNGNRRCRRRRKATFDLAGGSRRRRTVPFMAADATGGDVPRTRAFGEQVLYDNEWVRLTKVEIEPPGGRRFAHHVVQLRHVAIAAVLDATGESVLMIRRHRWVVDAVGWELPGGIIEPGETGAACAARETEEETGWRPAGRLVHLQDFEPMPGRVRTPHQLYLARGAVHVSVPSDPEEAGIVEWVPLPEAGRLARAGELSGSGTIVAVLWLLAFGH